MVQQAPKVKIMLLKLTPLALQQHYLTLQQHYLSLQQRYLSLGIFQLGFAGVGKLLYVFFVIVGFPSQLDHEEFSYDLKGCLV